MAKQYIPPVGFYFALSFKGEQTGFKEVLGISLEMETEEIVAGGENRFLHRVPTIASFQNLVLKKLIILNLLTLTNKSNHLKKKKNINCLSLTTLVQQD